MITLPEIVNRITRGGQVCYGLEYKNGTVSSGTTAYSTMVFVNNGAVEFEEVNSPHTVAVVVNDSDKPLRSRGMVFPNDLSDYVYKRSLIDRVFGLRGKPAIPPRSARLVLLKRPVKAQCVSIARSE